MKCRGARVFQREDSHFNLFYYVKRLGYHYLWQQDEAIEKYYEKKGDSQECPPLHRLYIDPSFVIIGKKQVKQ